MSTENRPSKKQRELLEFIGAFIGHHGYGPSYREIMDGLGYKSVSTVASHVDNLVAKGHLAKRDYSARSLEVVGGSSEYSPAPTKNATKSQEKWLVDSITSRFLSVERDAMPSQKDIDDLYVLVGSLQVLGLTEAATSFKARLLELRNKSRL